MLRSVKSIKSVKGACRSFLGLLWGPPWVGASRGGFPGAAYNGKKKQNKIWKNTGKKTGQKWRKSGKNLKNCTEKTRKLKAVLSFPCKKMGGPSFHDDDYYLDR